MASPTSGSPAARRVAQQPSTSRPEPVKNRPSQADRLAASSQEKARTNPRPAPRAPNLGKNVDVKA